MSSTDPKYARSPHPTKKDTRPTRRVPPEPCEVKGTTTAAGWPAVAAATLTGSRAVAPSRSGLTTAAAFWATSTSALALVASKDWSKPPSELSDAGRLGSGAAIEQPDALLVMTCASVMRVTAKKAA